MQTRVVRIILVLLALCGCATGSNTLPAAAPVPLIKSVLVVPFECTDPIMGEAARNVFLQTLARDTGARVLREGSADVRIEGTVVLFDGGEAKGAAKGAKAKLALSEGQYVSGITAVATRGGEVIAAANWGQQKRTEGTLPPEFVARVVAEHLTKSLLREGLASR
jgi:hypothetical protein